jgi:hypothetical protein
MDGEKIICDKCNGTGSTEDYSSLVNPTSSKVILKTKLCLKCFGYGVLDWIEIIVGKKSKTELSELILHHESTTWGE